MKSFIAKLFLVWLILAGTPGAAQYRKPQIDSLYSMGFNSADLRQNSRIAAQIYQASKAIHYKQGVVEALILFAENNAASGRYDEAFQYITQAENAGKDLHNPVLIASILTNKGLCYWRLGFYREAKDTYQSAVPVSESISNEEDRHYYLGATYTGLAVNYERWGNQQAKDLWDKKAYAESVQLERSPKYVWAAAMAAANSGNRFAQHRQYDSAEVYINKALHLIATYKDPYLYKKYYVLWGISIHAGALYDAEKKFDKAALYYQKAIDAAAPINYAPGLKMAYAGLARAYAALNQPREAARYFEKSDGLGDSLSRADKAGIKTPMDYIIRNREGQHRKTSSRDRKIMLGGILLLLVTTGGVLFYRRRFKREARAGAERLREMMRKKVQDEVQRAEELREIVEMAVSNHPALLAKYDEFDPGFRQKLMSITCNLTAVEIRFCLLLKLGFETKEIARYTKIAVRTVEGKKYRIRKKLSIPSDQDISSWMNLL